MAGYLTYCFSDWIKERFSRGVMFMRNGVRTDEPVRHPLPEHWREGTDYYVKADPDFELWTYSRCHKQLRLHVKTGDTIFFRTHWRGKQYFIGYFVIGEKAGDRDNPILVADRRKSLFLPQFSFEITPELIAKLNRRVRQHHVKRYHPNVLAMFLGRNYLAINDRQTRYLKKVLDARK